MEQELKTKGHLSLLNTEVFSQMDTETSVHVNIMDVMDAMDVMDVMDIMDIMDLMDTLMESIGGRVKSHLLVEWGWMRGVIYGRVGT